MATSLFACTISSGPAPGPASPTTATQAEPAPGTPSAPDDPTPIEAASAQPCSTNADCGDGVCEGEGCGDVLGRCMPAGRMCTRDAQAYCGCDGVTFRGSGNCPNQRFAHRGECKTAAAKADGASCKAGTECASGVCEGEGCDTPGVCMPAQRACTKDLREYCGCDGRTFRGSGSCPGARFSKRSAC